MNATDRSARMALFNQVDLYPVVTSEFCAGRDPVSVLEAIAEGGARIVQLREKSRTRRELYELACRYRDITRQYGMLLVINDSVDLALACDADAVHLGQDDLPIAAARRIAPELVLGNSTHNLDEALAAWHDGADYINVGPVYPTQTKSVPTGAVGLDMVRLVTARVPLPFSVMGGIKERHLPELLAAGCRHIAMVTEITGASDIAGQVRRLRRAWDGF